MECHLFFKYFVIYHSIWLIETLTLWWHSMKRQGITKLSRKHLLRTMIVSLWNMQNVRIHRGEVKGFEIFALTFWHVLIFITLGYSVTTVNPSWLQLPSSAKGQDTNFSVIFFRPTLGEWYTSINVFVHIFWSSALEKVDEKKKPLRSLGFCLLQRSVDAQNGSWKLFHWDGKRTKCYWVIVKVSVRWAVRQVGQLRGSLADLEIRLFRQDKRVDGSRRQQHLVWFILRSVMSVVNDQCLAFSSPQPDRETALHQRL